MWNNVTRVTRESERYLWYFSDLLTMALCRIFHLCCSESSECCSRANSILPRLRVVWKGILWYFSGSYDQWKFEFHWQERSLDLRDRTRPCDWICGYFLVSTQSGTYFIAWLTLTNVFWHCFSLALEFGKITPYRSSRTAEHAVFLSRQVSIPVVEWGRWWCLIP